LETPVNGFLEYNTCKNVIIDGSITLALFAPSHFPPKLGLVVKKLLICVDKPSGDKS